MFIIDDIIIGVLGLTAGSTAATAVTMGTLAVGATMGMSVYQRSQAKKAQSRAEKRQQAMAEEQARAAGEASAVARAPISERQMQKIMKQREISSLVDHYIEQEREGPQVYTLPTAQPSSPVVRANTAIHKFITGAA